jgi:hypothetical protein
MLVLERLAHNVNDVAYICLVLLKVSVYRILAGRLAVLEFDA